jgi:sodium/hydrogen antiporter
VPAVVAGIVFGPVAAKFLDDTRWGPGFLTDEEKNAITLGFMRVMISIQVFMAGYQVRSTPAQGINPM